MACDQFQNLRHKRRSNDNTTTEKLAKVEHKQVGKTRFGLPQEDRRQGADDGGSL